MVSSMAGLRSAVVMVERLTPQLLQNLGLKPFVKVRGESHSGQLSCIEYLVSKFETIVCGNLYYGSNAPDLLAHFQILETAIGTDHRILKRQQL